MLLLALLPCKRWGGGGGPGPHPPGMHIGPCRPCYNSSHAHRTRRQAGSQALESRCEEGRPTQAARDTPPPPTAVPSKEGETGGEGTEDGTQQEGKAIPYYMAGAHPANALLHTSGRYESQLYPATRGQGLGNWGQSGKGYVDLCQAPNPTRSGAKGWQRLVTPPPHARWRGGVTPVESPRSCFTEKASSSSSESRLLKRIILPRTHTRPHTRGSLQGSRIEMRLG